MSVMWTEDGEPSVSFSELQIWSLLAELYDIGHRLIALEREQDPGGSKLAALEMEFRDIVRRMEIIRQGGSRSRSIKTPPGETGAGPSKGATP